MLHHVKFVLFVLLLAIPLPTILFNQITFPLQIVASQAGEPCCFPWLGVPVLREGNVIQLPTMQLEVAEACSGIRSLMSLFTVAVIYGYLLERRHVAPGGGGALQHSHLSCSQWGTHLRHRTMRTVLGP